VLLVAFTLKDAGEKIVAGKDRGGDSRLHLAFKQIGIDILREKGFRPMEIFEEYQVKWAEGGRTKYVVDLAGIAKDRRVAVECGETERSKFLNLRKVFDEVLVIDAEYVIRLYQELKSKYFELKRDTDREIESLRETTELLGGRLNGIEQEHNRELYTVGEELARTRDQLKNLQRVVAKAWKASEEERKTES